MSLDPKLKRRNVFRIGVVYLVLSWHVAEVAGTLFPAFGIPDWSIRFLVIVIALGFGPALIISTHCIPFFSLYFFQQLSQLPHLETLHHVLQAFRRFRGLGFYAFNDLQGCLPVESQCGSSKRLKQLTGQFAQHLRCEIYVLIPAGFPPPLSVEILNTQMARHRIKDLVVPEGLADHVITAGCYHRFPVSLKV